ncbi:uncharacterized protein [Macrobrachium rosenbergii]|uniref:uncharacterized protein isoform X1 n=1 Tax=Macrobrachium rosenbergii TaxID=79674 RepID=UPI0034D58AE8
MSKKESRRRVSLACPTLPLPLLLLVVVVLIPATCVAKPKLPLEKVSDTTKLPVDAGGAGDKRPPVIITAPCRCKPCQFVVKEQPCTCKIDYTCVPAVRLAPTVPVPLATALA